MALDKLIHPYRAKKLMEDAWNTKGVAFANTLSAWVPVHTEMLMSQFYWENKFKIKIGVTRIVGKLCAK